LIIGLTWILAVAACSSSVDEKPSAQTALPGQANANLNVNANSEFNANAVAAADGTKIAPPQQIADANVSPPGDPLKVPSQGVQGKLENLRKSGDPGAPADAAALALKNARPAPDNSTFASYLSDAGYEIRSFKNHPHLVKVEKKTTGDGKQSIKVFLRSGKVIDLPGGAINPLSTVPAAFILDVAGVQIKPQGPPSAPAAAKKSGD
jgi:hypothetical protein